jgi:diguanylate cyclase (GGDEF)-like protein
MGKITRLKIGFAAGIIVMLANAIIPYQTFGWLSLANEAAESAQQVLVATRDVLSAMKDAESSHRGYVITGRDEFLKTYDGALRELRSQLARLHDLAGSRPDLGARLATLSGQVEDRVRQMERLIDLRREQGLEPSARAAAEGRGRRIMDGLRATAGEIVSSEQARLDELRRERARRSAITAYALALVSFLDLLVLGIVYYLVFRTIAERARAEAELRAMGEQLKASMQTLAELSITDALTGLYNRRYLDETLRRELLRAERAKLPVAVIMLDVDHFKRFNDTYGHDAGDAVLRSLAGLMQKHARGGDILCRYGGEEFAMIMPEMSCAAAAQRAERLLEATRLLTVEHGGRPLGRVTLSAGVALFPDHGAEGPALLQAADSALYAAKKAGRDRVVVAP